MPDEIVHIEVVSAEGARPSTLRILAWTGLIALSTVIILTIWPLLWTLLAAALVLAGLSTAKLAHRRTLWEVRFGQRAPETGIWEFTRYFAAWFFGILVAIPFAVLLVFAGIVGVSIVVFVAVLALIASLFSTE